MKNKVDSDPIEPVLTLQGIPWIMRKVINMASISMCVKQSVDDAGIETLVVEQFATGIKAETEVRKLDWSVITTESAVWGDATHRSRRVNIKKSVEDDNGKPLDPYLTDGWVMMDNEKEDDDAWIFDVVENKSRGWVIEQIWGFILVDGKKYHARKTLVRRGDEVAKARTRYEWKGETK
ncbi:lccl domain-containing protein [Rutstroemia sp. NJR-2017a BVV2]|nr:lccl domain-containing protein [Rutstroemia sp. NJR-2017a BVV2]